MKSQWMNININMNNNSEQKYKSITQPTFDLFDAEGFLDDINCTRGSFLSEKALPVFLMHETWKSLRSLTLSLIFLFSPIFASISINLLLRNFWRALFFLTASIKAWADGGKLDLFFGNWEDKPASFLQVSSAPHGLINFNLLLFSGSWESGHNSPASELSEMELLTTSCSSIKLEAWSPSAHASFPPSREPVICHYAKFFIKIKTPNDIKVTKYMISGKCAQKMTSKRRFWQNHYQAP